MTPTERLLALWDHLGIGAAHVATQMPGDIAGLAADFGSRLAGIVLCVPTRLDPVSFGAMPERLLMICGDGGLTAEVTARAETILVDNMSTADIREAVLRAQGRAKIEISGGVTLSRMAELATTGADFVSVGALTHSAPAMDISFEIEPA